MIERDVDSCCMDVMRETERPVRYGEKVPCHLKLMLCNHYLDCGRTCWWWHSPEFVLQLSQFRTIALNRRQKWEVKVVRTEIAIRGISIDQSSHFRRIPAYHVEVTRRLGIIGRMPQQFILSK